MHFGSNWLLQKNEARFISAYHSQPADGEHADKARDEKAEREERKDQAELVQLCLRESLRWCGSHCQAQACNARRRRATQAWRCLRCCWTHHKASHRPTQEQHCAQRQDGGRSLASGGCSCGHGASVLFGRKVLAA